MGKKLINWVRECLRNMIYLAILAMMVFALVPFMVLDWIFSETEEEKNSSYHQLW